MFVQETADRALSKFKMYLALSIFVPFFLVAYNYFGEFIPNSDMFQRTGAIITVCAILAEYYSSRLDTILNGQWELDAAAVEYGLEMSAWLQHRDALCLGMIVYGTTIWGFGDLVYKAFS